MSEKRRRHDVVGRGRRRDCSLSSVPCVVDVCVGLSLVGFWFVFCVGRSLVLGVGRCTCLVLLVHTTRHCGPLHGSEARLGN